MVTSRAVLGFVLTLCCTSVLAEAPSVDATLPVLSISERGELTMTNDDFSFVPWRSDTSAGKVQVLQYFGATLKDSKIFEPFTDQLQNSFAPGTIHVTTILNLDAAMWGTTGFVISELEKNKRLHPDASMVIDDEGTGVAEWDLGKEGSGLIITDAKGVVKYFTKAAMSTDEMAAALALVRSNTGS